MIAMLNIPLSGSINFTFLRQSILIATCHANIFLGFNTLKKVNYHPLKGVAWVQEFRQA